MQQWEYQIDVMHADDIEYMQHFLPQMGRDGWELVAVSSHLSEAGPRLTAFFKRQLEVEPAGGAGLAY
jgi:hypothetical protein